MANMIWQFWVAVGMVVATLIGASIVAFIMLDSGTATLGTACLWIGVILWALDQIAKGNIQ